MEQNSTLSYLAALKQKLNGRQPEVLLILGSGLGSLIDIIEDKLIIDYGEIGFPLSGVSGHAGRLVAGKIGHREVICMQGRFHLYEGYAPKLIKEVICAFAALGVKQLIVTNAAGSVNPEIPAGSLMLMTDHINFSGRNPLVGPNDEKFGPRFPDMSQTYDTTLRQKLKSIAHTRQIKLYEGVYVMVLGPNFETPAEVRMFRLLGGDAVGMSTVPEVLAATYAGMKVLGVSVITNMGSGLQTSAQSHHETLAQANAAADQLADLLKLYMEKE